MTVLCTLDEMTEGQARGFEINGQKLVLVQHRAAFFLYKNSCPHRRIPLEWQPDQFLDYDKNFIQCATHGALFKIEDGLCIAGPCKNAHLEAVPFQIKNGTLVLDPAPDSGPLTNEPVRPE
ncbi:MAG: Rieske (2Fe-2S) protein [Pontibacterium sp.]